MNLGADARQVYVAHAIFTLFAEKAHGSIILGDHRQRQTVFRVIVNAGGVFIGFEWDQGQVRTKNLFTNAAHAGLVLDAIHKRRQVSAPGVLASSDATTIQQNLRSFLASQLVVALNFLDSVLVDDRSREIATVQRLA